MNKIFNQAASAATELIEKAELKSGDVAVVGCSTSEVIGERIGTSGTLDVAKEIFDGLNSIFADKGIFIAAQCCEHLSEPLSLKKKKQTHSDLSRSA